MQHPPAVIVHGLSDARAAMAAARGLSRPITLLSGIDAASYAGCGWWRALVAASGTEWPDILDCGAAPGRAMEALRAGCRLLVLDPAVPAFALVTERAAAAGSVILGERPAALDLAVRGAMRRLPEWVTFERPSVKSKA